MSITAVVVAGDQDGDIDPLTPLDGVPMLVRAVRSLLVTGLVEHVVLLADGTRHRAVGDACAGLPVSVREGLRSALFPVRTHTRQREGTRAGDGPVTVGSDDVVLLHDAARPLAPPALVVVVVEAVRAGHAVAVPVLPVADTVKQVEDDVVRATPDRASLRAVQTPQAFRASVFAVDAGLAAHPLTAAVDYAATGGAVHMVAGHPLAFAVRSAWDLELAGLLAAGAPPRGSAP